MNHDAALLSADFGIDSSIFNILNISEGLFYTATDTDSS